MRYLIKDIFRAISILIVLFSIAQCSGGGGGSSTGLPAASTSGVVKASNDEPSIVRTPAGFVESPISGGASSEGTTPTTITYLGSSN